MNYGSRVTTTGVPAPSPNNMGMPGRTTIKKPLSFKRKKRHLPFQLASEGMKVQGPSHEEGGIQAETPEGKPVAEIEGDERIFSKEDTLYMEREAQRIIQLMQASSEQANEAARALGFKIVEMIVRQEKNQRAQEGNPETEDVDQAADTVNEFATHADNDGE